MWFKQNSLTCHLPSLVGDVVSIQVSDKLFHIHVAVLTRNSKFFENAMKSEWRTDSTKPIDISTTHPQTFEYYCRWLYTRQIVRLYNVSPSNQLAHLYVLEEHIMDTVFQDIIVDTFIRRYKEFLLVPDKLAIKILYAGTAINSPVRRLMVDIWAFSAAPDHKFNDMTNQTCVEFVDDLIPALLERRPLVKNAAKVGRNVD